MIPFEVTAGSVAGRDHRLAGRNSQDACAMISRPFVLTAFACDGCSSSPKSEVGANLGARLLAEFLGKSLETIGPGTRLDFATLTKHCERARVDMLAYLRVIGRQLGGSFTTVVSEHFLFTAIGIIATPAFVAVVAAGDGLYAINGKVAQLGPFPGNAPPYLGYGLLDADQISGPVPLLEVVAIMPTPDVQSVLVGTDGAFDLQAKADRYIPGTSEPLGPLSQFWENAKFFANPDALRRRLTVAGRDIVRKCDEELQTDPSLLSDDTTLIVLRRKEA